MADAQASAAETDAFFRNATTLTVSEAAVKLRAYAETMRSTNPDYQPTLQLQKTIEYAERFATNRNVETLSNMRNTLLGQGFTQQEIAMVISLQLNTAEEAKKLVPSLERYADEDVASVLEQVATYREYE